MGAFEARHAMPIENVLNLIFKNAKWLSKQTKSLLFAELDPVLR